MPDSRTLRKLQFEVRLIEKGGPLTPERKARIAHYLTALRGEMEEQVESFRRTAARCWAEQDRKRPIVSLIKRMRARKVTRLAERLQYQLEAMRNDA